MSPTIPFRRTGVLAFLVGLIAGGTASAQSDDPSLLKNRISATARFAFSISAQINNYAVPPNSGPEYDDGFVAPDIGLGADGKTWYWGYERAEQIAGSSLALHRADGSPRDGATESFEEDPNVGFEVLYGRDLFWLPFGERMGLKIGAEAGFSSLDANLSLSSSLSGSIPRTTDLFGLGGVTPPLPPYSGTLEGPGPLLDLQPSSSATPNVPATSSMEARVRTLLYGFKLGPYFELPVHRRFSVQVGAGLAAMVASTDFDYEEVITTSGSGGRPPNRSGSYSSSQTLIGFYGNAMVVYAINDSLDLYAGGQYQHLGEVSVDGGSKHAMMDFGGIFEGLFGLRVKF